MAQTNGGLDFSALYDDYFPLVSNLAFKMLANHDDCEQHYI